MSLILRPYQPTDANVITTWLKSEYLMRQWCADRYERYPVTPVDMNTYHDRFIDGKNSIALTMVDRKEVVGYITLRIPADDPTEQRIGFVLVDDSKRGRGLGKALVSMAVAHAFSKLGALKVSLGVFENNPAAIRCYESVGFRRVVRQQTESYDCLGATWTCIEMEISDNPAKKTLSDMTLEELWELFPIELSSYQPQWRKWAKEEIGLLTELLAQNSPVINHIGSTAIPGIQAKPIIDILVETSPDTDWQRIRIEMEKSGYICMSSSVNRMSFNKGYTTEGYAERVFHIHFHIFGDNDEILFRDYLNNHPTAAQEYERLKLGLLPEYRYNRDGYTEAKSDFIKQHVGKALAEKERKTLLKS